MKRASSSDIAELVNMMEEFYAEGGFPLNHLRAAEAFAGLFADDRLGAIWFIRSDLQNVGYIVLTLCYSMEYGGLSAFVDDLYVRVPFRKKRLGTMALTEVRNFCNVRSVRAVFVETGDDNAAALAVYRRGGFVRTNRQLLALRLASPTHES